MQICFQANVTIAGCSEFSVSGSTITMLPCGKPKQGINATVVSNETSDCVIEWDHDDHDLDVINYTVSFVHN